MSLEWTVSGYKILNVAFNIMFVTLELANLTKLTGVCVVILMTSVVGVETT